MKEKMKIDELDLPSKRQLNAIAGFLGMPDICEYISVSSVLYDIRNRMSQARSLIDQASRNLGG